MEGQLLEVVEDSLLATGDIQQRMVAVDLLLEVYNRILHNLEEAAVHNPEITKKRVLRKPVKNP